MIDRRTTFIEQAPLDLALQSITDSEIVHNFHRSLTALYPNLVAINRFCSHAFEEMIERTYYDLVVTSLGRKYGVPVRFEEHHKYGAILHCYRKIHHLECVPLKLPLPIIRQSGPAVLSHEDLQDKVLVFQGFRDKTINPLERISADEASKLEFSLVQIQVVSAESGYRFRDWAQENVFVEKEHVSYEFCAETYDSEEHRKYRDVYS